jgi:hypothetical protein
VKTAQISRAAKNLDLGGWRRVFPLKLTIVEKSVEIQNFAARQTETSILA